MIAEHAADAAASRVDATGTRRRIQAMVANGRPLAEIARLLGREPGPVGRILTQATVRAATAQAVSDLYGRLGDRIPEPASRAEALAAAAARSFAQRRGWPPSLAWEADQLGDPDGEPAGGWDGWQRRPLRGPARWAAISEDVEFLRTEEGLADPQIAERLGMTGNALERVLDRAAQASQADPELEAEAG